MLEGCAEGAVDKFVERPLAHRAVARAASTASNEGEPSAGAAPSITALRSAMAL